ncbi:MAG: hypothetical protein IPK16_01970 [Anaerolineales bacterium]|nr:hypothetical protein [Anaerolineales bacterium]
MTEVSDLFPQDAGWIGPAHPFDLHEVYLDFRSPVILVSTTPRQRAELHITADSRYRLWVNGRFVARGPARSWPWSQQVDAIDLSHHLVPGENCIAVQVYQPGYSHFSYVHRAAAGVLAALYVDGQPVAHTSNAWKVRVNAVHAPDSLRVSIYGSGVGVMNLAQEDGWQMAPYDDSGWAQARIVAPAGGAPWSHLQRRSLPYPSERVVPLTPFEVRESVSSLFGTTDAHDLVRRIWPRRSRITLQQDSAGWIAVRLAKAEAVGWLCDLGRDYTCQGIVEVRGAGGEETLLVSYADKLHDGELVLSDPATYCRVQLTDCLQLRAGDQRAETLQCAAAGTFSSCCWAPRDPTPQCASLQMSLSIRCQRHSR